MSMSVTTTKDTHGVFHSAVTVDVPSLTFTISKPSVIQCELSAREFIAEYAETYATSKGDGLFIDPSPTVPTITISASRSFVETGEQASIIFTISESVSDFDLTDVSVTNGTLSDFGGSGNLYSAVFTPATNSTADDTISVATGAFTNGDGNSNTAGDSLTLGIDTTV